jgi:hypothetical protein
LFAHCQTPKENEVGRVRGTHGRGEERVQGFCGKAPRKEIARKTTASVGGWDQNRPYGDLLGWEVCNGFAKMRIGTGGGLW